MDGLQTRRTWRGEIAVSGASKPRACAGYTLTPPCNGRDQSTVVHHLGDKRVGTVFAHCDKGLTEAGTVAIKLCE